MSSEEKMPITKEFELARSSCAFVVELLHHLCDTVVRIFRQISIT